MTDDKGYNGWSNYETWCTSLWIDDNEGTYHQARDMVKGIDRYKAAGLLKDWIESLNPLNDVSASLFTDLLTSALSMVDYYEIVDSYREE